MGATPEQFIATIEDLSEQFEAGEITSATLRLQLPDGSWEEVLVGYSSPEEADTAVAKLRRLIGRLH